MDEIAGIGTGANPLLTQAALDEIGISVTNGGNLQILQTDGTQQVFVTDALIGDQTAQVQAAGMTEEEFLNSQEFVDIVITAGAHALLFQHIMARILEISTHDVIMDSMDLYKS